MKKAGRPVPVVTAVVYYGEQPWDGVTNTKIDYSAFEKGDGTMCTLFEEIARESQNRGREEGWEEGRMEGRAEEIISMGLESNFSENSILEILQNRQDITLQKATEYFKRFAGQVHT